MKFVSKIPHVVMTFMISLCISAPIGASEDFLQEAGAASKVSCQVDSAPGELGKALWLEVPSDLVSLDGSGGLVIEARVLQGDQELFFERSIYQSFENGQGAALWLDGVRDAELPELDEGVGPRIEIRVGGKLWGDFSLSELRALDSLTRSSGAW